MKNFRLLGAALATALFLAACGGGEDGPKGNQNTSPYGKMVIFGDSLSDVGTHATQGVLLGTAGGKYTVNGQGAKIWVEVLADELGVDVPCAAKVGLESNPAGPFKAFAQAPKSVPGCYNYAQGGSRVTNPVGPWNKALLLLTPPDPTGYLGQLTEPVSTQIAAHLAVATTFAADDLVTVAAGANDLFMNLAAVSRGATPTAAVTEMGVAGAQLAGLIANQILTKGATRVVVMNMPDFAVTPFFAGKDAPTKALVTAMTQTFNGQLAAGLAALPTAAKQKVLQVDAYTLVKDFAANPATHGLDNVADTACAKVAALNAAVSLICNSATVVAADVSRYAFADDVHPTPYAHGLIEQAVLQAMVNSGWR